MTARSVFTGLRGYAVLILLGLVVNLFHSV